MLVRNWPAILMLACFTVPCAEARLLHVTQKPLAGIPADSQFGTISQAAAQVQPGDTVLIHGGVYREGVVLDKSGEAEKPVTIRAAEGESVVITGADRLTDWSQAPGDERVYSMPWPHKFVAWNKSQTHPDDDYHRLIGRCEQVFIDGYPLHQVLERGKLSRGTFFADTDAQLLYIQPAGNQQIVGDKAMVEAAGNKICMTRGAILENSTFIENRGNGIWFDIGNEDCEVRNCLIARNENAGIFYEISYGLRAHDNVIIGNGFAFTPGAWGASSGISISSSPFCTVERNLILGNKEGFNFREQLRSTPRIDNRKSEPVWNHDEIVRNNVLAWNRDAQVWGWFDVPDERHWPKSMQTNQLVVRPSGVSVSRASRPRIAGKMPATPMNALTGTLQADLSLEDMKLAFDNNLYCPGPGQGLFNWGATWKKNKRYETLDEVQRELSLDQGSRIAEFHVVDYSALDLRVPTDSPAIRMDCYPQGPVPNIRVGTFSNRDR